jgi:hypothetical protein
MAPPLPLALALDPPPLPPLPPTPAVVDVVDAVDVVVAVDVVDVVDVVALPPAPPLPVELALVDTADEPLLVASLLEGGGRFRSLHAAATKGAAKAATRARVRRREAMRAFGRVPGDGARSLKSVRSEPSRSRP